MQINNSKIDGKELPDGWFTEKDIEAYRELVSSLPNGSSIVEIGVWLGRSLCSISDIVLEKQISVTAIDTFQGTVGEEVQHQLAKQVDLQKLFERNIVKFYGKSLVDDALTDVRVIKATSREAFKEYTGVPRLVFIDADHSTKAVMQDIIDWSSIVSSEGYIAGHDYNWKSVKVALKKLGLDKQVRVKGDVWVIEAKVVKEIISQIFDVDNKTNLVTCTISTKDRYFSSLPLVLTSILNQSKRPDYLIVYDDSEREVALDKEPMYCNLMTMLDASDIQWRIIKTPYVGQVANHQRAFIESQTDLIWRVDDDVIPECEVLQDLFDVITHKMYDLAAVGGRVITNGMREYPIDECSSLLKDIYSHPNVQWSEGIDESMVISDGVEHLHCTFLYDRTKFDGYPTGLSKAGHREETIFTYQAIQKGYKLGYCPFISNYHLKVSVGGIRTVNKEGFDNDERMFREMFFNSTPTTEEKIERNEGAKFFAFLNNGVGDHLAFVNAIGKDRLNSEDWLIACCHPQVFDGINCYVCSIDFGLKKLRTVYYNEDSFNVYKFMWDRKWQEQGKNLEQAFKELYESNNYFPLL